MDSLTERTIRRLYERLEAFRMKGPIPALMAEFRVGAPAEEVQPLHGFADAKLSGSLRQLPDGTQLCRRLWLAGDGRAAVEFRDILCLDAGRVALPLLHAAGHRVGLGGGNAGTRWLWAVFELAELRLRGTDLRLGGDTVWRIGSGGVEIDEGVLASPGPLAGLVSTVGDTRYWKLADAVEASLAALDIAQLRQESAAAATPPSVSPASGRPARKHSTRKIDVDEALGKLETKMRKELVRELGSETAAQAALVDRLYSLSAEALAPMLKGVGCKTSARTIYRRGNSQKYESWKKYRRPIAPPEIATDPTRPAARKRVRSAAEARVEDAVESRSLSLRTGGRGTTRIGKTAAEKATDDAADRFARDAGVDLPPAE